MVLNSQGKVWAGHRIAIAGSEYDNSERLWQMPQGGIDKGEDPQAASLRELYEETGMESVSLLGEAPKWYKYDLPAHLVGKALKGKYRGQKQRWFAYRFIGNESEIRINPPPGDEKAEFDQWAWRDMDELPDLVIGFKTELYRQVISHFSYLKNG
jgi:putative (di)nucleoside polyphosphate hydrolase